MIATANFSVFKYHSVTSEELCGESKNSPSAQRTRSGHCDEKIRNKSEILALTPREEIQATSRVQFPLESR